MYGMCMCIYSRVCVIVFIPYIFFFYVLFLYMLFDILNFLVVLKWIR